MTAPAQLQQMPLRPLTSGAVAMGLPLRNTAASRHLKRNSLLMANRQPAADRKGSAAPQHLLDADDRASGNIRGRSPATNRCWAWSEVEVC